MSSESNPTSGTICGFIAILGAPNVGKSTLLNRFVGTKVSIVSPKVQTTRSRVLGICIKKSAQIIFVDTPGIFKPRRRLDRAMVAAAWGGAGDADHIILLVDSQKGIDGDTEAILGRLKQRRGRSGVRIDLVLNKIDLVEKPKLLELATELNSSDLFADIFMVSAETRAGYRFHDPSQVPDIEELTRELTPEEGLVDFSNREMASRLLWKPYMHNPSLPHYLAAVKTPALVVWGRQDAIVPLECGELYNQALSNSKLAVIDQCGHSPQVEKPQEFLTEVTGFLSGL